MLFVDRCDLYCKKQIEWTHTHTHTIWWTPGCFTIHTRCCMVCNILYIRLNFESCAVPYEYFSLPRFVVSSSRPIMSRFSRQQASWEFNFPDAEFHINFGCSHLCNVNLLDLQMNNEVVYLRRTVHIMCSSLRTSVLLGFGANTKHDYFLKFKICIAMAAVIQSFLNRCWHGGLTEAKYSYLSLYHGVFVMVLLLILWCLFEKHLFW